MPHQGDEPTQVRSGDASSRSDHGGEPNADSEGAAASTRGRRGLARRLLDARRDERSQRYEVRGRLGRGGMGEVVEVWDRRLRRDVALKRLTITDPDDEDLQRFLREAQVTSRLEHPNIPPVHDLGTGPDGETFFTMKRLRGETLSRLVHRGELTLHARLDIFLKVCDAVAYAHAHGVVHRDIKPSNVIVGAFREVYLLDWGLAKPIDDADEPSFGNAGADVVPSTPDPDGPEDPVTAGGAVLGTPGWMSPEQARGEHATVDPRSDVFALGVLLYVLLTGSTPFPGRGREAVDQVRLGVFDRPRDRNADVPWELEAVVLRAMALAREDRYPTAEALRQDVQRYLEGQPLQTVRYTPAQRAGKWAGRNRRPLTALAAVVLVGTLAAFGGLAVHLVGVSAARDAAIAADRLARLSLADSQVTLSSAEAELGRLESAWAALDRAEALYLAHGGPVRRARLARSALAERFPPPDLTFSSPGTRRHLAALSADASRVLFGDESGDLFLYTLPLGRSEPVRGREAETTVALGFAGDRPLRVLRGDGEARVVDARDGLPIGPPAPWDFDPDDPTRAMLLGDGTRLVLSSGAGGTTVFDTATGRPIGPNVPGLVAQDGSADGSRLLGHDGRLAPHRSVEESVIWDTATGQIVARNRSASAEALSPDGRWLARDEAGTLSMRDTRTGEVTWTSTVPPSPRLGFARGGAVLVAVSADERFLVYDAATGATLSERRTIGGPTASHGRVFFAPGGDRVATALGEGLRVWTLGEGDDHPWFRAAPQNLTGLALAPDDLLAAVVGWDGVARIFDWRSGALLRSVPLTDRGSRDAAFSPDGARLATADRDGAARVVDLAAGTVVRELRIDGADLAMGVVWRAEHELWVAYEGGAVVAFDPADGRELARLKGDIRSPWSLVGSPDGRRLAVTGRARLDPELEVWDLERRERIRVGPTGRAAYRASFSPDGRRLALGTHEGEVHLYGLDGPPDAPPEVLAAREEAVQSVALSHDGTLLAVGGYDGQLDLYDASGSPTLLHSRPLATGSLLELVFAADGTLLAASGDHRVYRVDPTRWERLSGASTTLRPGAELPPMDAVRWLELASGDALRSNWSRALEHLDRGAAAGAEVPELPRARASWAVGRYDEAREALRRAAARGEALPAGLALWEAAAPGQGVPE